MLSKQFISSKHIIINMQQTKKIALAIHGGAGVITRSQMTEQKYQEVNQTTNTLRLAMEAGKKILELGGTCIDAVEAAVIVLEDSPLFNAGKGSVYNSEGKHELDASFMEGKGREAGATCMVTTIKNPIKLARAIMEKSFHVMLVGKGAEDFGQQQGLELVPNNYFDTEFRFKQWEHVKAEDDDKVCVDHTEFANKDNQSIVKLQNLNDFQELEKKKGTVGAVALDQFGNIAAGTSTGGLTNKKFGRVGDSGIIGAGTYADNNTCAISCTGYGEYFQRCVTAYEVSNLMKIKKIPIEEACKEALQTLEDLGGDGGMVSVDKNGNYGIKFNSEGMYRAWLDGDEIKIKIYGEDDNEEVEKTHENK